MTSLLDANESTWAFVGLTALGSLRISRSRGWRRWLVATVVEATADGLRTLVCSIAGERAGAGRARRDDNRRRGIPHPRTVRVSD